jgi:hypothetical protein
MDDDGAQNEIVRDMLKDIRRYEQFRNIQRIAYMSREPPEDYELLYEFFNSENKEQKLKSQKEAFYKHQKAYVEWWKKIGTLPLPISKKIKKGAFILENYQISASIARALGKTLHYLGRHLNKISLVKNNLKDQDLWYILRGILFNSISKQ